jgi:hypothetical protein
MYYMGFSSKWDEQVEMCSSVAEKGRGIKFICTDGKEVILR